MTTTHAHATYEESLTGDWNGARSSLSKKGVIIEAAYTVDSISNISGGIKRKGKVLDNLNVAATFDGEKLFNIKGSTMFLYFLNNNGGKPNADNVGSFQGVDNIEISSRTAKLYEAWIEQNFNDDKISIRAGLYDINS
jgi:porin